MNTDATPSCEPHHERLSHAINNMAVTTILLRNLIARIEQGNVPVENPHTREIEKTLPTLSEVLVTSSDIIHSNNEEQQDLINRLAELLF